MAVLNTHQLECMLTSLITNSGSVLVLGVFPADRIPLKLVDSFGNSKGVLCSCVDDTRLADNVHYCFILNTDAHNKPGRHWLAFFYNHVTDKLEYFDSFGIAAPMYVEVYASLKACGLADSIQDVNASVMLQSVLSSICGQYCVLFLYWRAKYCNKPPTLFGRSLAQYSNAVQRDKYVVQHLRTLLSRSTCHCDLSTHTTCLQTCTCYAHI